MQQARRLRVHSQSICLLRLHASSLTRCALDSHVADLGLPPVSVLVRAVALRLDFRGRNRNSTVQAYIHSSEQFPVRDTALVDLFEPRRTNSSACRLRMTISLSQAAPCTSDQHWVLLPPPPTQTRHEVGAPLRGLSGMSASDACW